MLILRLASRNLIRQFGRNSLSMVSIIVGVMVIILGRGFAKGLDENMIRGQIDSGSGHVMAVPRAYPETGFRFPVENAYRVSDAQAAWLDGHRVSWAPRLIAAPRAIKGKNAMRVRLTGIGPSDDGVFPKDSWHVEGALPAASGEVLVASGPAKLLGVKAGDPITLENRTIDGAVNAMRYTVSGVLHTGSPSTDQLGVFAPLSVVDALLNAQGRVTHVSVRLARRDDSVAFATLLAAEFPEQQVRTWQSETAAMLEAGQMRSVMFDTMGFAMLLMAATGIANTVLMAAFERVKEIGTLRSMGLQRGGVLAMFATEGLLMGVIGGAIGVGLGGGIVGYYSVYGIPIMSMLSGKESTLGNVPIDATLYLYFSPMVLVTGMVVAVIVAMGASIYPAIAASRISPAEAVRS